MRLHYYVLKSLTMVGRLCRIKAFSPSLKQDISLEDLMSKNPKQLHKTLKPCKSIQKIEAFSIRDPLFKTLRLFKNVQIVTLSLSEDQIVQNHSIANSFQRLTQLNMTVHKGKETPKASTILKFFQQLLGPNLKNLKLDFLNSKSFQSASNLQKLLLGLGHSHLSTFKIQAKLKKFDNLEFDFLKKFLAQVELLVFQFLAKDKNVDYHLTHERMEWIRDNRLLDQINQAMDSNPKSLRIMFKTRPTINFETLFAQCTSLKSLCLQWRHYQPVLTPNISRLKTLKSLMFGFQALRDSEFELLAKQLTESCKEMNPACLNSFHFLVENSIFNEDASRKLLKLHQLPCFRKLKHYIIESFDEESSKIKKINSKFYQTLIQHLRSINSLESLRLYFGGATALCWKGLQNLLGSLHSLQKLELAVFSSVYSEMELYIPFESLPKLHELRLGFIGPLKKNCAQNLAKTLPLINKLKTLDITEGCLENLDIDSFVPLIQNFRDLKQIKTLTLRVPRKLDESFRYSKSIIEQESSNEAVKRIEKEAFKLFETNTNIEILNILFNQNYQFDIKHSR